MLTVVDCYTRESLAGHVRQSLKGEDVVQVLKAIVSTRGRPATVKTDNGSEFVGIRATSNWKLIYVYGSG
jgi:putative transposase